MASKSFKKIIFLLIIAISFCITAKSQITVTKKGDEYFNGNDKHIYAYLNNNYDALDPIEGIWLFNRIEFNNWGGEVSRTNNEFQIAIVRDKGNVKRAFIEVNLNRAFCKQYRITYSIQSGGNGIYPCLPEGCMSVSSQYVLNTYQKTITREAMPFSGSKAILVGVKTFPQGRPNAKIPIPDLDDEPSKVTDVKPRPIVNESGWDAYIDWGRNIFPSYILSMGTLMPQHSNSPDYKGDPLSNLGILIDNPRSNADVRVEIEATRYTKAVSESFTLPKRGMRYAIFPKVSWEYELLKQHKQPFNLDFRFKVWVNDKPLGDAQTLTARIRTLDDCPFLVRNYRGEKERWHSLFAAYVNEAHPKIKDFKKEILAKKLVSSFSGAQGGEVTTIPQVFAFWKLLRDRGVVYSSIADNGETSNDEAFSQGVRLFEDVVDDVQANCIDGTAILASCLKGIGINPALIIVPGHAFLGYYPDDNNRTKESMLFLETTMIGEKGVKIPDNITKLAYFIAMKKVLTDHFREKGIYMSTDEIDYFVFASVKGQGEFIAYKKKYPYNTFEIDVAVARQTIKPITRMSYTFTPVTPEFKTVPQEQKNINPSNSSKNSLSQSISNSTSVPTVASFTYQGKGTEIYDSLEFRSNAPLKTGIYYKVQLAFIPKYDNNNAAVKEMQKIGRLDLEHLLDGNISMYRALIGDFNSYNDALPVAQKAKKIGFKLPCIVRYKDGNRAESIYTFDEDASKR